MPTDHAHAPLPPPPRPSARSLRLAALIAGGVALILVVVGVIGRITASHRTQTWTSTQAIPVVSLVAPEAESANQDLVLPGTLSAFYNAPIFARVPGYLKVWYHDIGAHVTKGELLAVIDTPDLDQQLIQAKADLNTIEAKQNLAAITARRWSSLLKQDAVSAQETDEKTGDLAATTAEVNAGKAHVGQLEALKAFSRIVAPFDGVVTARKTDIGYLINAGAGASPTSELFDVAEVDKLRLYVSVPQVYGARIKPGVKASLTVPEYPGRPFPATLVTTANAVSDRSGTILVELIVDNRDGALKAGDYAQVTFDMPGDAAAGGAAVRLPSSVLIFRGKSAEVAVLGPNDRVVMKPVTVGRDLGDSIEISAGLSPTDRVINNPPDSITQGELVRVAPANGGAHAPG
ncbi:MAG: efflux RND transporter periplasmic adaptor subunit [Alphaproteobacteria bacterium]|jgi:RND family efflux transporter MFP subunit|nr:efflux RND transporter periplasmic adaptor subunit [Alphaproteobacteria bacterium]